MVHFKSYSISAFAVLFFCSFFHKEGYRYIKNDVFQKGEQIEYLVHYGFLNAGIANVEVSPKTYVINGRVCYKVDILGRTIGAFSLYRVQDIWRTYIDTAAFVPHRFYRQLEENNYRRTEITDFYPLNNTAQMDFEEWGANDPPTKERRKGVKKFNTVANVQDIVSGYYYLRMYDFNKMKPGEVITIPGVLEDQIYYLKIRYKGKEEVTTRFGKMHAHRLVPIMPENQMFSGESSVRFWVSDDKNKIPVRVEADMFIGKVVVEITNYKNLRHKFNFKK
ncbi:MAG: DUF3108 domain-containing protein [Microscillaceae bacterium]|nr:DUF3108 domain-containing protein [Microscillaceae bacterium]MDW8461869.1 DUF3108 domain-containing protein [Cytophagales bacterium]